MKLRPEEITSILKSRIEDYDVQTDLSEVGSVLQVGDGIARVHGLENCVSLERLEFEHGVVGIAFNLEEDNVGVALFGEWQEVKEAVWKLDKLKIKTIFCPRNTRIKRKDKNIFEFWL